MIYNNITNCLRSWCDTMTLRYRKDYEQERASAGQSLRFLPYLVTLELQYKLSTLVDRAFPDYDAYLHAVLELLSLRIDSVLKRQMGKTGQHYVQATEAAFLQYLESLAPDIPGPDLPYNRVIWDGDAERIIQRFREVWGYDTHYWYPLDGNSGEDKLFIAAEWIQPHWDTIYRLLGIPQVRIYEYGEAVYDRPHCAEVAEIPWEYNGCETAYCPKDFSWILYFSHENTVTFAGSILPQIKDILQGEQNHWNRFEWPD